MKRCSPETGKNSRLPSGIFLEYLGENPDREGLAGTPERVAKSYERLFGGYLQSPEESIDRF